LDNTYFTLHDAAGDIMGYSANGHTMLISKGELENTIPSDPLVVLEMGDTGTFDACGTWLNSAVIDGDKVRGWYHAEHDCDYDIGQTYKSIAYCESSDGGLSFDKIGYPDNQIITGVLPPIAGHTVGNGDHTVLRGDDGYYYVYYIDWDDYGHCVARSPISSGGVPGTWTKYFEGSWSQPGIGGNSSGLWQLVGTAVYNYQSGSYISAGSGNGISLAFGDGPVKWSKFSEPIVFAEGSEWTRTPASTELLGYPSFVPLEGGSGALGNSFWLYYMYLEPGDYFTQRRLVRRRVDISVSDESNYEVQAGVELSRYKSGAATWVTTTSPISGNFSYDQSMGYMLTVEVDNTISLYDCYFKEWNDHVLSLQSCDNFPGMTFLRLLGWVYSSQQPYTSPIYRCWNVETLKHSVSKYEDCEGNGNLEFRLGWTLDR